MPKKPIPVGSRFSRLLVLRRGTDIPLASGKRAWTSVCMCDCGAEIQVKNCYLFSGDTKSCGCLKTDICRARSTTHGHSRRRCETRIYLVWAAMHRRCRNPNVPEFNRYGGRGLTVCEQWTGSSGFANFLSFMGPGRRGWTIHRIDNDAGYCPENMAWATRKFQARHTSRNRILTIRGVTACLAELCDRFSVPRSRTLDRLQKGWDAEAAFFTPNLK